MKLTHGRVWLLSIAAIYSSSLALAAIERAKTETSAPKPRWIRPESRWRIFASGLAGYGSSKDNDLLKSRSPDGEQMLFSGVLSYETPHWVHDMGLGWMNSKLRTKTEDEKIKISTRAAVAEYGVRARLGKRWQLGPEINFAFGTDTTFGPSIGPTTVTPFIGGRVVYEMPAGSAIVRAVGSVVTDMNLANRRVILAMVGAQIGLPFGMPKKNAEPALVYTHEREQVRIQMDPKLFHFYAKSADLSENAREFLKELATALGESKDSWKEIEISGHADQRGSKTANLKLSEARAEAVAGVFKSNGLDRLSVHAFGDGRPADPAMTRVAWAKNRRVELVLDGVKDPAMIENKLEAFNDELRDKVWESETR